MSKLRRAAQGRDCLVRGPGCNGDPESVVLAHLRFAGMAGVGQKPPDICGCWACSQCHDFLDGRREEPGFNLAMRRQYALDALLRTLKTLDEEGLV